MLELILGICIGFVLGAIFTMVLLGVGGGRG